MNLLWEAVVVVVKSDFIVASTKRAGFVWNVKDAVKGPQSWLADEPDTLSNHSEAVEKAGTKTEVEIVA